MHNTYNSLFMPSANNRFLYTCDGVFNTQLKQVYPTGEHDRQPNFMPARHSEMFMRLSPEGDHLGTQGSKKPTSGSIAVYLPGQDQPVVTLNDIEGVAHEDLGYGGGPGFRMHHDKRIDLIPEAKLLVTIPSSNDRLILRRFDLDALLAKSGRDYLVVTSEPPQAIALGKTLSYQPAIKSKKGGVTYKIESGPKGMLVAKDGRLTWDVPADFAEGQIDVILKIADASGQEIFHSFVIKVRD